MQLYWETPDKRVYLYLGDAQNLSALADESIDMIATSPPYWGKRNYGEELMAIWGRAEDGCGHEWGEEVTKRQGGGIPEDGTGSYDGGVGRGPRAPTTVSRFCLRCNAWYGQLGLEPTWQLYIAHLCECAEEWWRVLKPTGNLFINLGDTFFGGKGQSGRKDHNLEQRREEGRTLQRREWTLPFDAPQDVGTGIPKMKLGIPFRLRFALNDKGWVSRDDVVWFKGKEYLDGRISKVAMPESVKRRFACSYEMVMRFVKTPKMNYYVNEKTLESRDRPPKERVEGQDFEWREHPKCEGKGCDSPRCKDGLIKYSFWHGVDQWFDLDAVRKPHTMKPQARLAPRPKDGKDAGQAAHRKPQYQLRDEPDIEGHAAGANPGDVWIIQPEPFKLEHYACWPSALCEMMIKVGCPKEVCPKCGKPRDRVTKAVGETPRQRLNKQGMSNYGKATLGGAQGLDHAGGHHQYSRPQVTIGWSDCGCGEGFVPGVVLDPFGGGSGRLAKEARKLGRQAIIVDLKEEYLEMSKDCLVYGEKELFKEKKRRKKTGMSQAVLW